MRDGDRIEVELTDEEIGVSRNDSSKFEEASFSAAIEKAGLDPNGNHRLHDIEFVDNEVVKVYLSERDEVEPVAAPKASAKDIFNEPKLTLVRDDEELDDEKFDDDELSIEELSPILSMKVTDDETTVEMNAGDLAAVIELLEFSTSIMSQPNIRLPVEARSVAISLERLRHRLGAENILGLAMSHVGKPMWMVLPDFIDTLEEWLDMAREEYDRQNGGKPSDLVVVHRGDEGLRTEDE